MISATVVQSGTDEADTAEESTNGDTETDQDADTNPHPDADADADADADPNTNPNTNPNTSEGDGNDANDEVADADAEQQRLLAGHVIPLPKEVNLGWDKTLIDKREKQPHAFRCELQEMRSYVVVDKVGVWH